MSQLEVDKIVPQSGTTLTIGDSGDTITIASGATLSGSLNADNLDSGTVPDARITGAYTGITNLTMSGNLTVDTNTLYVDASANLVGIGTTSPLEVLHIITGSSGVTTALGGVDGAIIESGAGRTGGLLFFTPNDRSGKIIWSDPDAHAKGELSYDHSSDYMSFKTNSSEAMRIDSSGNVGIGTTTPITPLQVNRDISGVTDALSLRANSNVTNEYIGLNFAKATWGKMSGIYGRNENNGNADGRLSFYTSSSGTYAERLGITSSGLIFPGSDNTQDLGSSGSRFNDLYLGGGLYVGGTGTANKLDDYEEGTWTATVGTGTVTSLFGKYTKIGDKVFCSVSVGAFSDRSTATSVQINGLPFAVKTGLYTSTASMHRYVNTGNGGDTVTNYLAPNTTHFQLYQCASNSNWNNVRHDHLSNLSAEFYFNFTYVTN